MIRGLRGFLISRSHPRVSIYNVNIPSRLRGQFLVKNHMRFIVNIKNKYIKKQKKRLRKVILIFYVMFLFLMKQISIKMSIRRSFRWFADRIEIFIVVLLIN